MIFHSSIADNNAADTKEDGQRKQLHSENGIRSPSLMGSNKDQGKLAQRTRLRESLENGKGEEVLSSTKKRKNQIKSSQRISGAIKVLFHLRRQTSLILLLKGINLEGRSASIASVHLLHPLHHRHLLPQSLQKQEV